MLMLEGESPLKRQKTTTLVSIPEAEALADVGGRDRRANGRDRVRQLETENATLREEVERLKARRARAFGCDSPSTPGMASYRTEDANEDHDSEDDAEAEEEMADEQGQRRSAGPGRPVNARVPFSSDNEDQFGESQLRKHVEDNSELVGQLEVLCQGSVGKLRQICERLLQKYDVEGFAVKIAVFDRVKAAIELLKPPPNGFAIFAERQRKELLTRTDDSDESESDEAETESDVQKELSRRWKVLNPGERESWNEQARDLEIEPYVDYAERKSQRRLGDGEVRKRKTEIYQRRRQLSAAQCEPNRKLYAFLLTVVAPPPAKFERDKTSLVPKFARAIGVDRKSSAWSAAIERRAAIDGFVNTEATWEVTRKRRRDAFTGALRSHVERFWEENTSPSPSERDLKRHRVGPKQYVVHQAHEQHKKTRALLKDYNDENPDDTVSYGMFQTLKPYYVRKACAQSCLCRYCENLRQLAKALKTYRKYFLDLDAERRAAAAYITLWVKFQRSSDPAKVEPAKWRRPKRGVITVASLLACEKKSDLLRILCCPVAVDSVALMDARLPVHQQYVGADDEDDDAAAAKRRQDFVASRERCMGCGAEECAKCGDINERLHRDRDFERQLWGPEVPDEESDEEPVKKRKTMKWSSYRTEVDDDGIGKADNELHEHVRHPSRFLDELVAALQQYKSHYYTCHQRRRPRL